MIGYSYGLIDLANLPAIASIGNISAYYKNNNSIQSFSQSRDYCSPKRERTRQVSRKGRQ